MAVQEPEGISFFSIKTGETFYAKLEPTIAALINSSDMGINASRGQDFGWRLSPKWVKLVREFSRDEDKMDTLASKLRLEDGESPTTTQILNYIYGRQVREYLQRLKEEDAPFAEQYQQEISDRGPGTPPPAEVDDDFGIPEDEPEEQPNVPAGVDNSPVPASEQVEEVPAAEGKKPTKPATSKK